MRGWKTILFLVTFPLLVGLARPARADSIDGNWCSPDGKRLTIAGPALVTPGGARLQGDYERHYFTYIIPPSEPGAGATVLMTLMGEELVHLRTGADRAQATTAPAEAWQRCGPSVSMLQRSNNVT
jgi:hypothetical protein